MSDHSFKLLAVLLNCFIHTYWWSQCKDASRREFALGVANRTDYYLNLRFLPRVQHAVHVICLFRRAENLNSRQSGRRQPFPSRIYWTLAYTRLFTHNIPTSRYTRRGDRSRLVWIEQPSPLILAWMFLKFWEFPRPSFLDPKHPVLFVPHVVGQALNPPSWLLFTQTWKLL